jgi:hypothetical protein
MLPWKKILQNYKRSQVQVHLDCLDTASAGRNILVSLVFPSSYPLPVVLRIEDMHHNLKISMITPGF